MSQVDTIDDRQCRCLLTFDDRLNVATLARALELLLDAAPVLACRYVNGPWSSRWERLSPEELIPPFCLIEPQDEAKQILDFLSEPMDVKRGPQVAVCLIRSERDILGIKMSHQAADATGLLDGVRLLGRFYRELKADAAYVPRSPRGGNRGQGQVLRGAGAVAVLQGCLHFRYPLSPLGMPPVSGDNSGRAFSRHRIDPRRVERLRSYARDRGAKLTDVLITAFYRALIQALDPPAGTRLPVQLTIDLRRYIPGGRAGTICTLAGTYYPMIRHRPAADFDETLKEVQGALRKSRTGHPWLGGALLVEILSRLPTSIQTRYARRVIDRERSTGTAHHMLSNIGVVDPETFEFGKGLEVSDVGLYGPVTFLSNLLITIYTFRGELSITSSFCDTAVDSGLVETFFDRFFEALPA